MFDWETAIVDSLASCDLLNHEERRQFAWQCREAFLEKSSAVRKGILPWKEADELFADVVDQQLEHRSIREDVKLSFEPIRCAWRRMPAWPEAVAAISDLRKSYRVVPLSLLSWSMAMGSSKYSGISWDGLLTCDVLGFYKPDPRCFEKALALFKVSASDVVMVASHPSDLYSAKHHGFRTAYVAPRLKDPGEDYAACDPERDFDFYYESFGCLRLDFMSHAVGGDGVPKG